MNLFEHMDALIPTYTKNDYYIYDKCKKFTKTFATKSITEITKANNISQAALTRFAQKLGFAGFNEFQFALSMQLKEETHENQKATRAETYGNILKQTEDMVSDVQLKAIAKYINTAQNIYTTGFSLASIPARHFDIQNKMLLDKHSEFIEFGNFPLFFPKNSILIIFSAESGKYYQEYFKNNVDVNDMPFTILITLNPKHPLRNKVNEVVVLPRVGLVNVGRTVVPETFAFLMFVDLLSQYLDFKV